MSPHGSPARHGCYEWRGRDVTSGRFLSQAASHSLAVLVLTLAFEFGFGSLSGVPLPDMLAAYMDWVPERAHP